MKIKKGDKVKIISGKDKGKEGTVEKVILGEKAQIAGINIAKKHVKPGKVSKEGGTISINKPVDMSRMMIICGKCKREVRVGYKITGGKKIRVCKVCGGAL